MKSLRITRTVTLPDPVRISRYHKAPELGPRILFFSGGSALDTLSSKLKNFTHNSIHLVTPFDSGGSSAKLRQAFEMPAIGDLRSRMMALADETVTGHPEVYQLFTYRLPVGSSNGELLQQLESMTKDKDPLVSNIPCLLQMRWTFARRFSNGMGLRVMGHSSLSSISATASTGDLPP